MKCPACKETNLVMSERQGIEIDYCPDCRGVWLDRGELDKIIERSEQSAPPPAKQAEYRGEPYRDERRGDYRHGPKRRKSLLSELFD